MADESMTIGPPAAEGILNTAVVSNVAALLQNDGLSATNRPPRRTFPKAAIGRDYTASIGKRLIDIIFSTAMLVLALPVMVVAAVAIKMTSPGPIFFRQRRGGRDGLPFRIVKFRTMTEKACSDARVLQATRHDPRVTKVGRFLRETSLDELPQLFNVLKGDMSLVGPRPHALAHDYYYGARIKLYQKRRLVRPGLTGLAQISGLRGETPDIFDMERRVVLDAQYVESASMIGDLQLLLATPREMLKSKTAV